jgi:molybdopterin synthase sulfur carrier subunit
LSSPPLSEPTVAATVRFWAAARQAAGHAEESCHAATIAELQFELAARPELAKIVAMSSFLVDGVHGDADTAIKPGSIVDVLPPFAGG